MDKPKVIIGIDPGASGGIAYFVNGTAKAVRMPKAVRDLQDFLRYLKSLGSCIAFMEHIQFRPQDSLTPGKQFGIVKMLGQYERLTATLQANDITVIWVYPKTWQSYLNLKVNREENKTERKGRYKAAAQAYYPAVKATLWNSDALLLLEFGRRKFAFDIDWITEQLSKRYRDSDKNLF